MDLREAERNVTKRWRKLVEMFYHKIHTKDSNQKESSLLGKGVHFSSLGIKLFKIFSNVHVYSRLPESDKSYSSCC